MKHYKYLLFWPVLKRHLFFEFMDFWHFFFSQFFWVSSTTFLFLLLTCFWWVLFLLLFWIYGFWHLSLLSFLMHFWYVVFLHVKLPEFMDLHHLSLSNCFSILEFPKFMDSWHFLFWNSLWNLAFYFLFSSSRWGVKKLFFILIRLFWLRLPRSSVWIS